MPRSLPGADRYRPRTDPMAADAPWHDPVVVKANAEVRIEDVLNGYFRMHVPYDAEGWKTRCPFAAEHDDGGIDRQFRIYPSSNTGYCFALHGTLDPVRLWRRHRYFPSLKDASQDLLKTFGIEYRAQPYWERYENLRQDKMFKADPDALVQAVQVYLTHQPGYQACQYDDRLLRGVNYLLNEVHEVCNRAKSVEGIEKWLIEAKQALSVLLLQASRGLTE